MDVAMVVILVIALDVVFVASIIMDLCDFCICVCF